MNDLAHELEPIEQEDEEKKKVEQPELAEAETKEQPEQQEEPKPEKPPKGFVKHELFHEERMRRKELQAQLQQVSEKQEHQRRVLEERFNQLQNAMLQQNQPRPQVPTFEDDPVNALKHGVESTQAELAQMRAWQQQEWQRNQAEQQQVAFMRQLEARVSEDLREFVAETPDYMDAYNDLLQKRYRQYIEIGYTPQEAQQAVASDEYSLAADALRRGKSPASVVYALAKNYGYTKKEAKEAVENVQKMETLQKGVKAAQSLGSGGAATGKVTVDAIANMSDDDFDAFMKSGGWAKLG